MRRQFILWVIGALLASADLAGEPDLDRQGTHELGHQAEADRIVRRSGMEQQVPRLADGLGRAADRN